MQATVRVHNCELTFTDSDVIDLDSFIADGEYNPHNVRPWLLHDHGFALAVVFADCLQDALDIAADNGKLDRFQIDPSIESERDDYLTPDFSAADSGLDPNCPEYVAPDGKRYWWRAGMTPAFLGNASEPFDIDALGYVELVNPKRSFVALWSASEQKTTGAHFA